MPVLYPHEFCWALNKRDPETLHQWLGTARFPQFWEHVKKFPPEWYLRHPLRAEIERNKGHGYCPVRIFGDDFQTHKKKAMRGMTWTSTHKFSFQKHFPECDLIRNPSGQKMRPLKIFHIAFRHGPARDSFDLKCKLVCMMHTPDFGTRIVRVPAYLLDLHRCIPGRTEFDCQEALEHSFNASVTGRMPPKDMFGDSHPPNSLRGRAAGQQI